MKYSESYYIVTGDLSYIIDFFALILFAFIGVSSTLMLVHDIIPQIDMFIVFASTYAVITLAASIYTKHKTIKEIELIDDRVRIITHSNSTHFKSIAEVTMVVRKPLWSFHKIQQPFAVLSGNLYHLSFTDGSVFIFLRNRQGKKLQSMIDLINSKIHKEILVNNENSESRVSIFTNWDYVVCVNLEIMYAAIFALGLSAFLTQSAEELNFPTESLWPLHLFITSAFLSFQYILMRNRRAMVEKIQFPADEIIITSYSDHIYNYPKNSLVAKKQMPKNDIPFHKRLYLTDENIASAIELTFNDGRVFYITDQTDHFDEIMSHLE